jgi:DNA primase
VHEVVLKAGGAASTAGGEAWVTALLEASPDDTVRAAVTRLAVEAPMSDAEPDQRYAGAVLARVQELAATRRVGELKQRLQRLNPVEAAEEYHRTFAELVQLEQTARALRDRAIGSL